MRIEKVKVAFGMTVCNQRKLRDMTQQELADMIGVSQVTINKIEHGRQTVSLEVALVLSKLLAFSLDRIPVKIKAVFE